MKTQNVIEQPESASAGCVERAARHPAYVLTVIFVVMPINGAIMACGNVWISLVFMAMQIPWAIQLVCELRNNYARPT